MPLWLCWLLPVAWGLLLSPIALLDVRHAGGRASFDQSLFHEHTIDAIARTWPLFNLTYPDHFVAMTPGYQWLLASVSHLTGMGDPGLRLVSLGFSVLGFGLLAMALGTRSGARRATLLLAPLMASVYVANSGAWMLADNAGWFWVGLLSLVALRTKSDTRWALLAGLGLLLAVWTRQNLLFLALPIWAAAWMRPAPHGPKGLNPLVGIPTRVRTVAPVAMATIPAIASIAYLYSVWGGLVPYEFQGQYDGANPSNIALQLVMLAAFGVFFLPSIVGLGEPGGRQRLIETIGRALPWIVLATVLAGLAAAAVPTTYAPTEGRAGLVWRIGLKLNPFGPIGHMSPVVVVMAAIGGGMLALILACLPGRQRWILGALFAGFGIAQGASSEVWQRYHEPFVLLFLAITTTMAVRARPQGAQRLPFLQWGPIAALALVLAVLATKLLWEREISPWRQGADQTPFSSLLPEPPDGASSSGLTEPE